MRYLDTSQLTADGATVVRFVDDQAHYRCVALPHRMTYGDDMQAIADHIAESVPLRPPKLYNGGEE